MTEDNTTYGSNVVGLDGQPIKGGLPAVQAAQQAAQTQVTPRASWPTLPQMQALGGFGIDSILVITKDTDGIVRSYRDGLAPLETIGLLEVAKTQILLGGAA